MLNANQILFKELKLSQLNKSRVKTKNDLSYSKIFNNVKFDSEAARILDRSRSYYDFYDQTKSP